MKKLLIVFSICGVVTACTSNQKSGSPEDTSKPGETQSATAQQSSVDTNAHKIGTEQAAGSSAATPHSKGETLISQSDCLTCHKLNEKLVGPSYVDIANKYPATEATHKLLAGKIIKGGSGVWGTVPMTPHTTLSEGDAEEMVKYIMTLKTN